MLKRLFNNTARQKMRAHNDRVEQHGLAARQISSIGLRAKVTRADGTEEPERLVSYGHRNPLIHVFCAPLAYLNGAFWNWYYTRNRRSPT
jgi:hypothetical protein